MVLAAYERVLARRPILVKTAAGAVIACCGDATAQYLEQRGSGSGGSSSEAKPRAFEMLLPPWYDTRRAFAIVSLGAAWNGPFMHMYFNWLERRFPQAGGIRNLLSKVAINQLLTNSCVYLPLFYSWTGYMYGRTVEETVEKAKREYIPSLKATWIIFTPVNFVNFYLTPVRHQVSVNIIVSFVYNTTLSFIAGECLPHPPKAAASALLLHFKPRLLFSTAL